MKKTILLLLSGCFILNQPIYSQWKDGGTKITTTQNVGIGTDNPAYKLDVNGVARLQNTLLPVGSRLTINVNDNFTYQGKPMGHYAIDWGFDTWNPSEATLRQSAFGGIKFFTQGQPRLVISKVGNVGIGIENPVFRLDVNGTVAANDLFLRQRNIVNGWKNTFLEYDGHALIVGSRPGNYTHNQLMLRAGGSDSGQLDTFFDMFTTLNIDSYSHRIRLASNGNSFFNGGNVGIGTSSPQYKLDVAGTIYAKDQLSVGERVSAEPGEINRISIKPYRHTGGSWHIISRDQINEAFLDFSYSNFNVLSFKYFNKETKVGIGVKDPQNKLDVAGTIRATEVKVEAGWADFVFAPDYNLRSLEEVKAHIDEYKHLPDIPSEAEVKEHGVSLGEMQSKLLQKIEELTLYIIKQDEKNKELEKEILNLKTILAKE